MSGTGFSEHTMRDKLSRLTSNQEAIQTISLWLIHHNRHHGEIIVQTWLRELRHERSSSKIINLIYLANDVIQNSRKKYPDFMRKFYDVLESAFRYTGKIPGADLERAVEKVLNVWSDRKIYSSHMIEKLRRAAAHHRKSIVEFSPPISSYSDKEKHKYEEKEYDPAAVDRNCEDVLKGLRKLEFPPSADADTRNQISTFPESLATTSLLATIRNREEAEKLLEDVSAVEPVVSQYCNRLAGEMLDRRNMQKMLSDLLDNIQSTVDWTDSVLRDVKKREEQAKADLVDVRKAYDNLPDPELDAPDYSDEPLPSADELFEDINVDI